MLLFALTFKIGLRCELVTALMLPACVEEQHDVARGTLRSEHVPIKLLSYCAVAAGECCQ